MLRLIATFGLICAISAFVQGCPPVVPPTPTGPSAAFSATPTTGPAPNGNYLQASYAQDVRAHGDKSLSSRDNYAFRKTAVFSRLPVEQEFLGVGRYRNIRKNLNLGLGGGIAVKSANLKFQRY
jgi:hypothetical protein